MDAFKTVKVNILVAFKPSVCGNNHWDKSLAPTILKKLAANAQNVM